MRVEKIDLVTGFKYVQNAPLKLGGDLATLAEKNRAAITSVTVPAAAPPNMPRFVMQSETSVVQVALDRIQLSVTPPTHISSSIDETFAFAKAEGERLLRPIGAQDWMENQWSGAIVTIAFPMNDSLVVATSKAATALTSLPWAQGELKSFQLHVGKLVDGYFRSFTIAGYEHRTVNFQFDIQSPGETQFMEMDDTNSKVEEVGISVVLDVNNRSFSSRPSNAQGLSDVLEFARRSTKELPINLNLGEVVQ